MRERGFTGYRITNISLYPKFAASIGDTADFFFATFDKQFWQLLNQPKYQLKADDILSTYEFLSEGPKGKIVKLIQFTATNYHDVFNLAFGDKDSQTGQIDDKVISNNSDSEMVLATVVSALYAFTDKHPDAWIYATGNTRSRTRLYRMGITKYIKEVKSDFQIFGEINKAWQEFEKEVDYESFLVKRKNQ